uniref:Uncharacterized protein n=1 Tax=Eutreptiella gymnastica TaxID=73025 RepID=A0A7S4CGA9_9EUGL
MSQAWTKWKHTVGPTHVSATRCHPELIRSSPGQGGTDAVTAWAAKHSEQHEAIQMMALYEWHYVQHVDIVKGGWPHIIAGVYLCVWHATGLLCCVLVRQNLCN